MLKCKFRKVFQQETDADLLILSITDFALLKAFSLKRRRLCIMIGKPAQSKTISGRRV
jgi:hypothetical protein